MHIKVFKYSRTEKFLSYERYDDYETMYHLPFYLFFFIDRPFLYKYYFGYCAYTMYIYVQSTSISAI